MERATTGTTVIPNFDGDVDDEQDRSYRGAGRQQRKSRKRGFAAFEETSAQTYVRDRLSSTSNQADESASVVFQLRGALERMYLHNGANSIDEIPADDLRGHAQVLAMQQQGGNLSSASTTVPVQTTCPLVSSVSNAAQTARSDNETLRSLTRFGYTEDIDWRRFTIPERLCIVESVSNYETMSKFNIPRFLESFQVANVSDPLQLFSLYNFVIQSNELLKLQQKTGLVPQQFLTVVGNLLRQSMRTSPRALLNLLSLGFVNWWLPTVGRSSDTSDHSAIVYDTLQHNYYRLLSDLSDVIASVCSIRKEEIQKRLNEISDIFLQVVPALQQQISNDPSVLQQYRNVNISSSNEEQGDVFRKELNDRLAFDLATNQTVTKLFDEVSTYCLPINVARRHSLDLTEIAVGQLMGWARSTPNVNILLDNNAAQLKMQFIVSDKGSACQMVENMMKTTATPFIWKNSPLVLVGEYPANKQLQVWEITANLQDAAETLRNDTLLTFYFDTVQRDMYPEQTEVQHNEHVATQTEYVRFLQHIRFLTSRWLEAYCK